MQPHQLTNNDISDVTPVYSPSKQRIAYSAFDGNDFEIYTMDRLGGTRTKLTDNTRNDISPSWQPVT